MHSYLDRHLSLQIAYKSGVKIFQAFDNLFSIRSGTFQSMVFSKKITKKLLKYSQGSRLFDEVSNGTASLIIEGKTTGNESNSRKGVNTNIRAKSHLSLLVILTLQKDEYVSRQVQEKIENTGDRAIPAQ